ncbi:MAG: phenylacetic acid degradation operon negative regulatory protein [bacterium]|jgi:phenylacetic acid degradation operon negative regulatory protein
MSEPDPLLKPFLTRLHGSGRLRVWSVVISIFGDLVQPRQQTISVQELLSLTRQAGVEENAVRTALSRLAKEGWVERHKDGRHAFYGLSNSGKTSFLAATERIYSHSFVSQSAQWNLGYFDKPVSYTKDEMPLGFPLSKHWQLINDEDAHHFSDANIMLFPTTAVDAPGWVLETLLPDNLAKHYRDFLEDIKPITKDRDAIRLMSPLCALTTRFLLIHAWRRMVLRHPLMPQGLLPVDWPGTTCHEAICSIYPQLVERSEQWWEVPTSNEGIRLLTDRFVVI